MKLGETTQEWCCVHGHQDFFLGVEEDEDIDSWNESLHCPECFPEHEDNPKVEANRARECERICHY